MENRLYRLQRAPAARADRCGHHNFKGAIPMKSHQLDQELEKVLGQYVDDFLANNHAGRALNEWLRKAGIGIRPIIDHLTFRTHNIDRRAEEFVWFGFEHTETIEYNNWFAKVYRREG